MTGDPERRACFGEPTPPARASRASTTRTSRSRRCSSRARCVRTSPPSTRSRASRTTSRTKARGRSTSVFGCSTSGPLRLHLHPGHPGHLGHLVHLLPAVHHTIQAKRLPLSLFDDLLSAFRQDVTVHRYATWSDLLDYCRRSANPVGRLVLRIAGYDDPAARSAVGRALHGAAARELLAGPRTGLGQRAALRPPRGSRGRGRVRVGSRRAADHARVARRARRGCGADARPLRRRPWRRRRRVRPIAVGAAADVARRRADPGPPRARRLRRVPPAARARPGRRAGHRLARAGVAVGAAWHATPASTIPSWSCPPRSAAPSSPSGISAGPWTMRWMKRERRARACSVGGRNWTPVTRRKSHGFRIHGWQGKARPPTPQGRALRPFIKRFNLPRGAFEDLIDGVEMDLTQTRYPTFADLHQYCLRVASAVGLVCVEIFGYRDPATRTYASELGVALQLTNILRDVPVDFARGRIYIPMEDLDRFGVTEADLRAACAAGRGRAVHAHAGPARPSGGPRPAVLRSRQGCASA